MGLMLDNRFFIVALVVLAAALLCGLGIVSSQRGGALRGVSRLAARLCLVVASLAGTLTIAEWGVRYANPGGLMQIPPRRASLPSAHLEKLPDGNAYWDYRGEFEFDEHGYRGGYEAPADGFKMVVLGDSVAFGAGVAHKAAFPHLLREQLGHCAGGQLYDLAVPAYSALQERIAFQRKGAAVKPDLVLQAVVTNDTQLYTVIGGMAYDIRARESYGQPVFSALPLPDAVNEALFLSSALYQSLTLTTMLVVDRTTGRPKTARKMAIHEQQRLHDAVKAAGAKLVVALLPPFNRDLRQPRHDPFYDMVRDWAASAGVPVLDLQPALAAKPLQQVTVDGDTHMSVLGHELAARALWRWLGRSQQLPKGCTVTSDEDIDHDKPVVSQGWLNVPAGDVTMGYHDGQFDEKPPQRVSVSAFAIQRTEVTSAAYQRCVTAGACRPAPPARGAGHPVTGVTWADARAYCRWIGGDLPTEAQWERAARGDDGRRYPWGDQSPRLRANCGRGCYDVFEGTAPVGSFPAGVGPFGTYDQAGNVEEWVADWYKESYPKMRPATDPSGPTTGLFRVVRGGEYQNEDLVMRSSNRFWSAPQRGNERRGMRCAK
jgi:formylglycine-generating enzyme